MTQYGFAYYTTKQASQFAFYQIPKALFSGIFSSLSNDERILYAMMRDRLSLSLKNHWIDEEGHVYIIYTTEQMMEDLGVSKPTLTKIARELETFGLITRKKRGQGNASLIFVMDFTTPLGEDDDNEEPDDDGKNPEVKNLYFKKSKNFTSRSSKSEPQDVQELDPNKTNNIKTDSIKNNNTPAQAVEPIDVVVQSVKKIVREPITDAEALAIAKAAGYRSDKGFNAELVSTAYNVAENSGNISNVVGYMIAAIKEGYQEPIKKKKKTMNSFRNFEERHTDYDALFAQYDALNRYDSTNNKTGY